MSCAVFPGSFDPPTHGHLDIINRSCRIFDKVYILVAVNPYKDTFLSLEERKRLLYELTKDFTNIEVFIWKGFIVDFMKEKGIRTIIRGLRGLADFADEFEMYLVNQNLDKGIDTIWFPANSQCLEVRSSIVKMLCQNKKDISSFVPSLVENFLRKRINTSEA